MSETSGRRPRVVEPERQQGVIRFEFPVDALPAEHPARVIWQVLGKVDFRGWLSEAKAVEGQQGRATVSPRMKLALWLYAISRGIGSAREIARLTTSDDGFRWIVGDLTITHSALSEFRACNCERFDALLTDILATLIHKRVLSLDLVAQDGMRVRTAATAPSFRTYGSLLECREQAALHLKAVLADADNPEHTQRQHAAREQAARDFQRRVEEAIATVEQIQETCRKETTPRASTTDAEARVMKMADGGFRPAYNVQMATAGSELGGPRTIVGIRVTNVGSDMNSIPPMLDDIQRRTGALPKLLLADANHAGFDGIRDAARRGVVLLVPVPERSANAGKQGATDDAIAAWRARMDTPEAKRLYRARASLCELSNAHMSTHHGIDHFLVRGLKRVTAVALLGAIAANILQHAATLLA